MASQETIAFICVAQRNSDRNGGGEATNTKRKRQKRPPKVGKGARRGRRVGAKEREKRSRKTRRMDERMRESEKKKKCVRAPARRYLER